MREAPIAHHHCPTCAKTDRCSVAEGENFFAAKNRLRSKMAADCAEDDCPSRLRLVVSNGHDRAART